MPTVIDPLSAAASKSKAKEEDPDKMDVDSDQQVDQEVEEKPEVETNTKSKAGKQVTLVTEFTKKGDYILSGTNKGALNIIRTKDLELVRSFKISSSNIKQIRISSSGRSIVVNASDRTIRLFNSPDLSRMEPESWDMELEHKFHDVVNRLQWNSIAMSSSGEYVVATTYESAHDIYMWETSMGSLVKIYEGPKEELVDIEFHPNKAAVAATGLDTGAVYLWTYSIPQKWSALAPDFVELEENIEYEEREDEFDLVDEAAENKKKLDEEGGDVDVITIERNRGEYTEDSFVIPMSLGPVEDPPVSDDDD
ncbi:COMPASS subunit protein SWD1 [Sugiyamaella lignohabitans]|uniref:COMPASS subunit protein SWD1 n=1 Tax=Sugiyamaella lignohabitans TaxID=796027 RepID=A0A167DEH8_9ASCO|nr:COMPASS subunit protein SWD1 [Sugiyamaella lignohabitans]ANB12824.1 COMPASS subunit protein SWD1 [Sugiyamaella lignohabitans]